MLTTKEEGYIERSVSWILFDSEAIAIALQSLPQSRSQGVLMSYADHEAE